MGRLSIDALAPDASHDKLGAPITMIARTERRIRELASSGRGKVKIGRTVGCGISGVQRILAT